MSATEPSLFSDVMEQGSLLLVRLDGSITEDNRLGERLPSVTGRKILLNLARIERINSCGVRDFVKWIQALEGRGNQLHFVQCSPVIVSQINMVRNFCGAHGQVVSVQAPYFCATCDAERRELFLASAVGQGDSAPPALCETCGSPMDFDDLPESYFAFAKDHGSRPVDPEVLKSMNRFDDVHLATKVVALKELSSSSGRGSDSSASSSAPGSKPGTPGTPAGSLLRAASDDKQKK